MTTDGIVREHEIFVTDRPVRCWVKCNEDILILPDGQKIWPVLDHSGAAPPESKVWPGVGYCAWSIHAKEWVPGHVYLDGLKKADEMLHRWKGAITRWTGRRVAEAIIDGHPVHSTTQRLAVALILDGFKIEAIDLHKGSYQRTSESYGTYFHFDTIVVAKSSRKLPALSGETPYQSEGMASVFGSSGLTDSWTVTGDRIVSVTCTQG